MTNEMTAEEAIKILNDIDFCNGNVCDSCHMGYRCSDINKVKTMAIKALEQQVKPMEKFDDVKTHIQRLAGDYKCWDNRLTWEEALELNRMLEAQPCEDCISRQAVLDMMQMRMSDKELYMAVYDLPPVKPKYTDEEIDKAQAVEQAYVDKMVELAIEETKRPKGKWIKCKSRFGVEYFKCSECGRKLNWIDSDDNYCNSCGSDNSESTKELYKEKLAEISGGNEDGDSN